MYINDDSALAVHSLLPNMHATPDIALNSTKNENNSVHTLGTFDVLRTIFVMRQASQNSAKSK